MKRDRLFRDLLEATAKETGVKIADVERTVEFYLKTCSQLIQWDNPVTIHLNYIGDLAYNHKWKNKVEEMKAKKGLRAHEETYIIPYNERGV